MQTATIDCPSCKRALDIGGFLSACSSFWPDVNVVQFTCPACLQHTDARIEQGRISLGYVYAAGSPHFCGMVETQVEGLVVRHDKDQLAAELGDTTWTIPVRAALGT